MKKLFLITVMISILFLCGCATLSESTIPEREPDIRGVITYLEENDGNYTMMVVWTEGLGEVLDYDAASVYVNQDTFVWEEQNGVTSKVDAAHLVVGDIVSVWFVGPVAESYPVQVGSSDVLIGGSFSGNEYPTPKGLSPEMLSGE